MLLFGNFFDSLQKNMKINLFFCDPPLQIKKKTKIACWFGILSFLATSEPPAWFKFSSVFFFFEFFQKLRGITWVAKNLVPAYFRILQQENQPLSRISTEWLFFEIRKLDKKPSQEVQLEFDAKVIPLFDFRLEGKWWNLISGSRYYVETRFSLILYWITRHFVSKIVDEY